MDEPLPFLSAELPGVPLVARAHLTDFRVEELPAYVPCGTGDHVYFTIEKTGLSTHDAVRRVASALGVRPRDIGYAGLKDARGVTRQVLSLEHGDAERVAALQLEQVEVVSVNRHTNKLRRGHLHGNRFVLKLRGEAAGREPEVRAVLAELERAGVPNYFGPQRFGLRGDNWRIGLALLRGDHDGAAAWIGGLPSEADGAGVRRARELFADGNYQAAARAWPGRFRSAVRLSRAMHKHRGDARKALRAVGGEELRFCVSAYQSHLFNRIVAARLEAGPGPRSLGLLPSSLGLLPSPLGTLLEGDLAWRHAGGAVFRVEDPAREQPRADSFEISPTGPLFGRRMTRPEGEPGRIEEAVLTAEGQTFEDFRQPGRHQWKGARRPLRVPLTELELAAGEDEHGAHLELRFGLPAGSYATAVLREIHKRDRSSPIVRTKA